MKLKLHAKCLSQFKENQVESDFLKSYYENYRVYKFQDHSQGFNAQKEKAKEKKNADLEINIGTIDEIGIELGVSEYPSIF